jgi:hypothetical protein
MIIVKSRLSELCVNPKPEQQLNSSGPAPKNLMLVVGMMAVVHDRRTIKKRTNLIKVAGC